MTLLALGLTLPDRITGAWRNQALTALKAYYPEIPDSAWNAMTIEFSDRSTQAEPEVLIYVGVTRQQARARLSPERAQS